MSEDRYMLNTKTNRLYPYHPVTMNRPDMVEISTKQAKNIMAGKPMMLGLTYGDVVNVVPGSAERGPEVRPEASMQPDQLSYYKKKLAVALELLNMSSPEQLPDDLTEGKVIIDDFVPPAVETGEPTTPETPESDVDPEIAMLEQVRSEGKGKAKVEAYCLEKFGIEMDRRMRLPDLVDKAISLRKDQINREATEANEAAPEQPEF